MIVLGLVSLGLVATLFLVARQLHQARERVDRLESRLASVLSRYGVGLSIWNQDGCLIACNEKFREYYPETPVTHGLQLEDLLRFTATRGLVQIEDQDVETWVTEHLAALQTPRRAVAQTAGGRWLAIDIGPTNRGEVMMLYSDVTEQREAETAVGQVTARANARAHEVDLLRRAIEIVGRADSVDSAASALSALVCEWSGWAVALAYRVDPSGEVTLIPDSLCVTVEALASAGTALSAEARRVPEGLVRRVLQSQRVTWIANLESDPTYSPERRAVMVGLLGACGVPVVYDGRVVAVLEFLSSEPLVPSPSRAALLESIGGLAGMAGPAAR